MGISELGTSQPQLVFRIFMQRPVPFLMQVLSKALIKEDFQFGGIVILSAAASILSAATSIVANSEIVKESHASHVNLARFGHVTS